MRKDGSQFWANVVVTALFNGKGHHRGFAKVARDLTERRQMEQLSESNRRINEFLAMLAHELRNPLAPIRNAVNVMKHGPPAVDTSGWVRDVIDCQTAHLTRLVDDLLDVSRITSGKIRLRVARIDVGEIVNRAVEAARPALDAKRHQLTVGRGRVCASPRQTNRRGLPATRDSIRRMRNLSVFVLAGTVVSLSAQAPAAIDWAKVDAETMQHFQALLRFDTTDPPMTPPGVEKPAVDYLKQILDKEGIPTEVFAVEPNRPNLVARLKGNGSRRPLLLMAHTDTVNVDPKKWSFPPFSATRDGGYVYSRGSVDDKDNVTATVMTMLLLKRNNVRLDRDVIALFEAGEEGATRVGIQFMANQHLLAIEAEYCLAEGGNGTRERGRVKFVAVQTVEKIPRGITLTAKGVAGHGSVPLQSNAIVHLADAVAKVAKWQPPVRPNETTAAYFKRLATISSPEEAERYRNALSPDPKISGPADEYFRANEPRHASMLRTSVSPNIFQGGYRSNVIPSEATATLDVRMLPDEDPAAFLAEVKRVVNDPAVEVAFSGSQNTRPAGTSRLNTDAFAAIEANVKEHYNTLTLPTMSTGATDMAYLRAKGIQCYGIGPALDIEDGPKGFGAHSDQERILESELFRFVRFNYDLVLDIAGSK